MTQWMPVTRCRMTSDLSRLFDSRLSERPGAGYPSCNTELCRLPRNMADPHGYYSEIGVMPWATEEEIRFAVRVLYRRLHPDTGARPDSERLQRVKLIAEVLLDSEAREVYNRTPPGRRMLDKVYMAELNALDFSGLSPEDIEDILAPDETVATPTVQWFDYLAINREPGDMHLAQRWYAHLMRAARVVGYRCRIKVLLHDGEPFFHHQNSLMAIPRSWSPSVAVAFALLTAVANLRPGSRHARTGRPFVGHDVYSACQPSKGGDTKYSGQSACPQVEE